MITRWLTEPSALAELMSVGTWQTRLGTSKFADADRAEQMGIVGMVHVTRSP